MKLLLCKNCQDVIRLVQEEVRTCRCGKVSGKYINDLDAIYSGKEAIPLGFANSTLANAIQNQPDDNWGKEFTAFVIPKKCSTFVKVRKLK
mgnify:CR=1 FL=1